MATFKKFEHIEGWKKARELTKRIYVLSRFGAIAKDFGLRDRRASVSTMSNIAEGHDRGGSGEFIQFLATAKALPPRSGLIFTLHLIKNISTSEP